MSKHAYTILFSPLPTSPDESLYFDLSPIRLPCSEDFPLLHYHDRYEIGLCIDGEGMFLSQGIYSYVSKGDVIFIPPNINHYSRSLSGDKPCICRFAYFEAKAVEHLVSFICKSPEKASNILNTDIPPIIRSSDDPKSVALLTELVEACCWGEQNITETTTLRLALFLIEARNRFNENPTALQIDPTADSAVTTVCEYLSLNYIKRDTTAELAMLCHLSESQLRRRFIKAYGIPPIAYKNLLRCKIAAVLLRRTQLSVSEISARVGYQDTSDFYRAFRKSYGCSPSAYRTQT